MYSTIRATMHSTVELTTCSRHRREEFHFVFPSTCFRTITCQCRKHQLRSGDRAGGCQITYQLHCARKTGSTPAATVLILIRLITTLIRVSTDLKPNIILQERSRVKHSETRDKIAFTGYMALRQMTLVTEYVIESLLLPVYYECNDCQLSMPLLLICRKSFCNY